MVVSGGGGGGLLEPDDVDFLHEREQAKIKTVKLHRKAALIFFIFIQIKLILCFAASMVNNDLILHQLFFSIWAALQYEAPSPSGTLRGSNERCAFMIS